MKKEVEDDIDRAHTLWYEENLYFTRDYTKSFSILMWNSFRMGCVTILKTALIGINRCIKLILQWNNFLIKIFLDGISYSFIISVRMWFAKWSNCPAMSWSWAATHLAFTVAVLLSFAFCFNFSSRSFNSFSFSWMSFFLSFCFSSSSFSLNSFSFSLISFFFLLQIGFSFLLVQ